MHENDLLMNQAFCIPINESEVFEKEIDGTIHNCYTFEDQNYHAFLRNGQWYFIPEADVRGGRRSMTRARLDELETLFNMQIPTIGELSAEETEV